jgi:regulator of sigma E protease
LLSFLVVIGVCVIIHEGGHYAAAVWRKVKVHEFAFGMGPGILTKRAKSGTLWAWRLFPIGGFVRMEGDDDEPRAGDTPDPSKSFNSKRSWERFIIIAGGAFMNILLAWILTTIFLSANSINDLQSPVVGALMPEYPAEIMGALPGDRVLSINGKAISEWPEIRKTLQSLDSDEVSITVRRGEEELTLSGTIPFSKEQGARLWGVQPSKIKYPLHKAAFVGMSYCWDMSVAIYQGLKGMILGTVKPDVMGPVGIARMAGDMVSQGFWMFIMFLAVINLNLGFMNLLPLPALDGGRLVFLFGEMVSGRKFPEKWENRIHLAGLVLLLALIAFVTWQDIMKWWADH